MFISAVNIPSEQKAGLKRELSQQQEGLFKEKKMLNFCCSEKKNKKKEEEANPGMEYYSVAHTIFFFFPFFSGFYPKPFSTASDHL